MIKLLKKYEDIIERELDEYLVDGAGLQVTKKNLENLKFGDWKLICAGCIDKAELKATQEAKKDERERIIKIINNWAKKSSLFPQKDIAELKKEVEER